MQFFMTPPPPSSLGNSAQHHHQQQQPQQQSSARGLRSTASNSASDRKLPSKPAKLELPSAKMPRLPPPPSRSFDTDSAPLNIPAIFQALDSLKESLKS